MTGTRVLVLGDLMRDIVVRPAGPLRPGTDQRAVIRDAFGGSGANQAAWLARFGVPVRFVGCVGHDDRAAQADRLRRHGIEPVLAAHPDRPTGTLVAMINQDGERSFLTDRGANDGLLRSALPANLLDDIGHLHVSGYAFVADPTRSTALGLLAGARLAGIPVSIDPGSAGFIAELGATAFLDWVEGASLCVVNAAEAEALTATPDPDQQLARLTRYVDLIVLKRGPQGAAALSRDGSRWESRAQPVEVVDTIGAGDAFLAAFLAARLAGTAVGECLELAVQAGTMAVTQAGGWPTLGAGDLRPGPAH